MALQSTYMFCATNWVKSKSLGHLVALKIKIGIKKLHIRLMNYSSLQGALTGWEI